MPTYYRPGVYFEETLRPLSNVNNDPAEASAAFVGKTSGGPVGPILVTSWTQYQALFGAITYEINDLAYAVFNYFANGGSGCYVIRALPSDATASTLKIYDTSGSTATVNEVLNVTAGAPGTWASSATSSSRVYVTTRPTATGSGRFDFLVDVGTSSYLAANEQFLDLSMDPADPRYAVDIINSPVVGSQYVTVARSPNIVGNASAGTSTKVPLTGGTDGVASLDLVAATQKLDSVDRNFVVNVPNASTTDLGSLVTWAQTSGRHFIVADAPKPASGETAAQSVTAMTAFLAALPVSSQIAVYGPWYYGTDPGTTASAMRLTAPGGAVVATYMTTDASRGVFKAPAGVATTITGAINPYISYTSAQLDALATSQVNVLRTIPGAGVCIWGARTTAISTPDRYVPIRRLLIAVKSTLTQITRFAIFEGNDEDLRATVEEVVTNYLQTLFDLNAFKGQTPDQAYYVTCDDTNNTPATSDAGLINVEVGLALKSPAEFIVIRLGQQQAGAIATDSLEA